MYWFKLYESLEYWKKLSHTNKLEVKENRKQKRYWSKIKAIKSEKEQFENSSNGYANVYENKLKMYDILGFRFD